MAKSSLEMKYAGVHIGENHKPYPFIFYFSELYKVYYEKEVAEVSPG